MCSSLLWPFPSSIAQQFSVSDCRQQVQLHLHCQVFGLLPSMMPQWRSDTKLSCSDICTGTRQRPASLQKTLPLTVSKFRSVIWRPTHGYLGTFSDTASASVIMAVIQRHGREIMGIPASRLWPSVPGTTSCSSIDLEVLKFVPVIAYLD